MARSARAAPYLEAQTFETSDKTVRVRREETRSAENFVSQKGEGCSQFESTGLPTETTPFWGAQAS